MSTGTLELFVVSAPEWVLAPQTYYLCQVKGHTERKQCEVNAQLDI